MAHGVSIIHANIELTMRRRAYAMRVAMLRNRLEMHIECRDGNSHLLPHFPHMLHMAEHVAAPQQLAAMPIT